MPWSVKKGKGPRPYKIVKATTGKVVGTSKTAAKAMAAVRAMYSGIRGGK